MLVGAAVRQAWILEGEGNRDAAIDDLLRVLKCVKHIDQTPIFVHFAVGTSIESIAIGAMAELAPKCNSNQVKHIRKHIAAYQRSAALQNTIDVDRDTCLAGVQKAMKTAKSVGKTHASVLRYYLSINSKISGTSIPATNEVATMKRLAAVSMDDVIRAITSDYARLHKLCLLSHNARKLPMKEFIDEIMNENDDTRIVCRIVVPTIAKLISTHDLSTTNRSLLLAGLEILLNGEDAIQNSKDPHGVGPFSFEKTPGGFSLRSAILHRDKPFELVFGRVP